MSVLSDLDTPTNELIAHFQVLAKLLKKYGKRLFSPTMLEVIKKSDVAVHGLLCLLVLYKKSNLLAINNTIKELKKRPDYVPNFDIYIIEDSSKQAIQDKITSKFPGSVLNLHQNINLWIEINWEGWHYKRNIDQDLQRILW